MADMVNYPPHYTSNPFGLETIEITRHFNFDIGNALKYILRAGKKGNDGQGNDLMPLDAAAAEVKDLRKAVWYIQDHIRVVQEAFQGYDLDDPYGNNQRDVIVSQDDQTEPEGSGEPHVVYFGSMPDYFDDLTQGEGEALRRFIEYNPGLAALVADLPAFSPKRAREPRHRSE